MTNLRFLVLAALFVGATGCDFLGWKPDNGGTPPPALLLPLKVGNEWIMERTVVGGSEDGQTTLDTIRVVAAARTERGTLFRIRNTDRLGLIDMTVVSRPDGIWKVDQGVEHPMYRYPAQVGDTYTNRRGATTEVTAVADPFVAANGQSYRTIVYDQTITEAKVRADEWLSVAPAVELRYRLARGVGFVVFECVALAIQDGALYEVQRWNYRLTEFRQAR